MIPKNIIELAIKGGYNVGPIEVDLVCDNKYAHYALDPLFWEALGIGLGNKDEMRCKNPDGSGTENPNCSTVQCEYAGYKDPKRMFDGFMETIWYGWNTEKFWESLQDKK